MNSNEHVYCTECAEFRLDDEDIPYCPYEDKCDINNCEDSRPFKDRPYWINKELYKLKDVRKNICQMCFETEAMEGYTVCKECLKALNE